MDRQSLALPSVRNSESIKLQKPALLVKFFWLSSIRGYSEILLSTRGKGHGTRLFEPSIVCVCGKFHLISPRLKRKRFEVKRMNA